MLAKSDFESESSFLGSFDMADFGSKPDEDDASNNVGSGGGDHPSGGDWGVVSLAEDHDDVGWTHSDNESELSGGILILDGIDSNNSRSGDSPSELSMPRTESLPTDIGTLGTMDDRRSQDSLDQDSQISTDSWTRATISSLSMVLLGLAALICSSSLWFVMQERNSWRSSAQRLEEEVKKLQLEAEELKMNMEVSQFDPLETQDDSTTGAFTLLDNCWVRAKADIKLGSCGKDTSEYINDLFSSFWHTAGVTGSHDGSQEPMYSSEQAKGKTTEKSFASVPLAVGEAFAAASEKLTSKVEDLLGTHEEGSMNESAILEEAALGLSEASTKLGEAMAAASEALTFELRELSDDPWTYLADSAREVMKDASYTADPARVRMKGLMDKASDISSASSEWGDAMGSVGDIVADKIAKAIDDPLLYLERKLNKNKNE